MALRDMQMDGIYIGCSSLFCMLSTWVFDMLPSYSAASLLAILFAIPFGLRVRVHREAGRWASLPQAFYHAHLELFLGNACLGVGVMMLLALTVERYVSVCRPGRARALSGPPRLPVVLIPLLTFAAYMPTAFRWRLSACSDPSTGGLLYRRVANHLLEGSLLYDVYKVALELVFKVCPTLLLAALNLRIMLVYRRSCERRRRMTLCRSASSDHDDTRHFAEERRLVLLLGSTSILFLVCVSPMVILNVTLSQGNLSRFPYQVFRAVANLLEVTNYSLTFYIYCLFSEDFRATLLRTLRWPWGGIPSIPADLEFFSPFIALATSSCETELMYIDPLHQHL
ncbi:probable G-protein coupled receptor AH9.1 [Schistocerca cancellata]|uniref:probable G-protein coupled receptor AH9.1 n=1 Tax=Schistocerca cancellata TaxID=274614 RepID=UPI00211776B4|nr:probable G-protein coupled receptor AH9.1 [Schistocerca cancellata]